MRIFITTNIHVDSYNNAIKNQKRYIKKLSHTLHEKELLVEILKIKAKCVCFRS